MRAVAVGIERRATASAERVATWRATHQEGSRLHATGRLAGPRAWTTHVIGRRAVAGAAVVGGWVGRCHGGDDATSRGPSRPQPQPSAQPYRKIRPQGQRTVEVARPEDEVDWLESRVAALGGYVVERRDTDVQLRVPVDEYERLLQEIRERGRVLSQQIRALDVTEQHRDLTIRLANARMSRERLLKLLETAEKVEDLLRIEKELQRLTTDIERLTAQLENLDLRVATSRIDVAFRARREPDPVVRPKQPSRFAWIRSIGAEHVLERF